MSASASPSTTRFIVKYKDAAAKAAVLAETRNQGGMVARDLEFFNAVAIELAGAANPGAAYRAVAGLQGVAYIERDEARYSQQHACSSQVVDIKDGSDYVPYGVKMVGVYTEAGALHANFTPSTNGGNQVIGKKVCIIDSGLLTTHEDFATKKDFVTGPSSQTWNADGCSHGTHVAGTIAAVPANGKGVVGLNSLDTPLHIVRVFDDSCSWAYVSWHTRPARQPPAGPPCHPCHRCRCCMLHAWRPALCARADTLHAPSLPPAHR